MVKRCILKYYQIKQAINKMTRKHFIAISTILKNYFKSIENGWSYDIVEAFADFCKAENTQFDYEKFIKACKIEKK